MSAQPTVLIVEDDPAMLRGLKDNFEFEGYKVVTATDGDAGLKAILGVRPDLVILDVMLPKVNGYEVCRFIRQEKLAMPIMMLTAKGQESDIVLGLKLGADDYVTKPFSIKEVLARAEVLLRRQNRRTAEIYTFGDCRLDCEARSFTRGGKEVPLSPKEFELLRFFASRPGQALSRDLIMNSVWGYDAAVTSRSITPRSRRDRSTDSSTLSGTRSSRARRNRTTSARCGNSVTNSKGRAAESFPPTTARTQPRPSSRARR